jgi:hypothetical protein
VWLRESLKQRPGKAPSGIVFLKIAISAQIKNRITISKDIILAVK